MPVTYEFLMKPKAMYQFFSMRTEMHSAPQINRVFKNTGKKKEISVPFGQRSEHVLVDHVAAGIMEPGTLDLLLHKCHERKFHVETRDMAEHLFELDLLGVHKHGVRDLCRAEFLALAAVNAGVRDMGEANKVEHEVWRDLAGSYIRRVLGRAVHAVADGAG